MPAISAYADGRFGNTSFNEPNASKTLTPTTTRTP